MEPLMPILFSFLSHGPHTAVNRRTQRGIPHFELNLVGLIKDSWRDVCYSSVRAKITASTRAHLSLSSFVELKELRKTPIAWRG